MEFFNKKQDVIDLQLTGYGKQLLSRGLFKPVYYAFSDDGVIYDSQWISGSNGDAQQSDIETRIQEETPRLKTQYRKVGAEKAIFNSINASSFYAAATSIFEISEISEVTAENAEQVYELFQSLASNVGFAEAEKLIQSTLGTKSFQNSFDPAWTALFYHGEISGSTPHYQKNNILVPKIPQLNCTLTDRAYRMMAKYNPYELLSKPKEVSEGLRQRENVLEIGGETQSPNTNGLFFEQVLGDILPEQMNKANLAGTEFELTQEQIDMILNDKRSSLFIEKDFLFISLEEANVDFGRDNFMIEVFEVDTVSNDGEGEEQLTKMFFQNESPVGFIGEKNKVISETIKNRAVEEVFYFEVDEQINSQLGCYLVGKDKSLKKQSLYVDSVFDCQDVLQGNGISIDPYTSLPEVNVGDAC
jgi:hypothetical protein